MKYSDGRVMHIGDVVLFRQKMLGTVQAVLDMREFSPVMDPSEFSGIETGLMVEFHDGSALFFEETPGELLLLKRNDSYAEEVRESIRRRMSGTGENPFSEAEL
ncbi:hypothetical protein [Succinimonas amylolytica]|uniref:hypothetical protein n=1 Tax=Succinimonas amylolytica TaxID=83769 RepID=UPI0003753348|nr:hypothetical protein [Succinimonas amylolytica]